MSWLHILPLLAASAATVAVSEAPVPAENPENAELIKLQQERYERVTVPVTIKGQGPFRFMVDTGSQATVVSSALANRLGLTERSPATVVGMASRADVQITEIPQLGLGSREFYIRSAPILEAENIGGADGILGLDSLQDQRVLIDFEKQRIFVADAKQLGGDRGYEIVVKARRKLGQLIITGARLNGIDVDVIVDTGSQSSIGNMALFAQMSRTRGIGDNTLTDVNGHDLTSAVKVVRKLEINRMNVNSIPIMFADAPPFRALGLTDRPALILGIDQLKLFRRVAIDFPRQRILFDLPREANSRDPIANTLSL
ncbi:MAG: aspartyl protease family protein [Croceibacterium sp.]